MKALKQILVYIIWTLLAILLGIAYIRILTGPGMKNPTGFLHLLYSISNYLLFILGVIMGFGIAILFILIDIFYLKKRLENNMKSTVIRFIVLLGITIIVAIIHYILEIVVDVI